MEFITNGFYTALPNYLESPCFNERNGTQTRGTKFSNLGNYERFLLKSPCFLIK